MNKQSVDIFILSGFLGSGKSTLLKELIQLERKKGRRIGVLMNELGEISIDSAIIPSDTPLKEMLNGCICCTIQGELSLQLNLLIEEHELDVIYIESTGAAHPIEVIDACTHPILASKVNVKAVITVVNAKQWYEKKMSIKLKKFMVEQVKYADIVLINKKDQVEESVLSLIKESIKEINDQAIISIVSFAKWNPSFLDVKGQTQEVSSTKFVDDNHNSHVHNHLHLRTVSFPVNQAIDRIQFLHWLERMKGQLFRAKGFIYLKETPGLFLFNYAYGEPVLERYALDKKYDPVLVFIGEDIDRVDLEKGLRKLQAKIVCSNKLDSF
ncbi:CobW family GTP-binding protein [Halalkalibacter alkaliphilus]|uniref:GTP-binding protein n=1 Tax=Halalkalibacter alkaliphilus TaxID=2917993 RepID=A0A9X2CPT2_9BACI|nr:GTP-binding protein [Halalkalibacter alkaliphilus]MCL7746562.1 GTP-binding protein [Halalkalibacter alkaliphilus]